MDELIAGLLERARAASWHGARLEAYPVSPAITLRARDGGAVRLAAALDVAVLPQANRVATTTTGALLAWLRPDEWVLIGEGPALPLLVDALGADGAVVDTGASRVGFALSGPRARDILASCCPIDVSPARLGVGQCAQTLIGHVGVFLAPVAPDRYLVAMRPSHADYVVRWLVDGMMLAQQDDAQGLG